MTRSIVLTLALMLPLAASAQDAGLYTKALSAYNSGDFDTSAGNFQIPVTARVEFSPNHKLDFGLEFTLLNVKPPQPQSPIDNRFLSLFMQARI